MQCRSNLLSAESLLKTGIFADVAGDFRQLTPQNQRIGSLETNPNVRKAAIFGHFSYFLGSVAERRNGWLGREDSNLRKVESKSADVSSAGTMLVHDVRGFTIARRSQLFATPTLSDEFFV